MNKNNENEMLWFKQKRSKMWVCRRWITLFLNIFQYEYSRISVLFYYAELAFLSSFTYLIEFRFLCKQKNADGVSWVNFFSFCHFTHPFASSIFIYVYFFKQKQNFVAAGTVVPNKLAKVCFVFLIKVSGQGRTTIICLD